MITFFLLSGVLSTFPLGFVVSRHKTSRWTQGNKEMAVKAGIGSPFGSIFL